MTSEDSPTPKDRIVDLMRASTPAEKRARPRKLKPAPGVIYVAGDGNVVANGGNVQHVTNVHHHQPARPKVVVKTGDGTIDAQQKAVLQRLLRVWVDAYNAVKVRKLSWAAAWGGFNKAMRVNGYAELRPEQFGAACAWLQRQAAIVTSARSAPRKLRSWRTARYAAIKARCGNQLGDEFAYVEYTLEHFAKSSLTELSDAELERTYRYVMGKARG